MSLSTLSSADAKLQPTPEAAANSWPRQSAQAILALYPRSELSNLILQLKQNIPLAGKLLEKNLPGKFNSKLFQRYSHKLRAELKQALLSTSTQPDSITMAKPYHQVKTTRSATSRQINYDKIIKDWT